ncbi:MAG: hypothetical protein KDJ62_12550 [Rhodobiaceae bacterium]|nr:hypothetical protein [Rhodobiaceae bacterium]
MLTIADIRAGLNGASGLMRGDRDAMREFDVSFEGFWKSFFAILVILPVLLLYIHGEWQTLAMTEPPSGDPLDVPQSYPAFVLKRLLVSAVDWLAYPLIILAAAGPLGIENRVVPYIVAQNWSTVIVSAVVAAPGIMFGFGLMSGTIAGMMTLALFAFALRYFYLVARIALDAPVSLAIGLVAFNAVSSIFLSQLAMRLI